MEVSVRELENRLSEYLRRVQTGQEIVITSPGRPVGRLTAARKRLETPEEAAIARLRALPWNRSGKGGKVQGSDRPAPVPRGTADDIVRWLCPATLAAKGPPQWHPKRVFTQPVSPQ